MDSQKLLFWRFLGVQEGPGTPQGPNNSFIPVLNRFWIDLGPNLDRFGVDFGQLLDRILDDVSNICCLLFVVCCLLFVVCCLLLAVCCWLFVLYLVAFAPLLFGVCCLLLSAVCRVLCEVVRLFFLFAGCLLLVACTTFTELSPTRLAQRYARSA